MKKYILLLLSFRFFNDITAQNQHGCLSNIVFEQQLKENEIFKQNQLMLEEFTKNFTNSNFKTSAVGYTIPVVFHVIYSNAAGNISDAQIIDQINILNKEFKRLQADTALTPTAFKPLASAFNVEFRLATKDPQGNCTNGINRVYSDLSNCSFVNNEVKSLSYWPSNQYLNIWLVQSMRYSTSVPCNGGGYATFPGGSALLDGVNIRSDLIGSIGTAATNSGWGNFKGRYLIHELGHWFNLRHIWGDANCGNDFVSDTPVHENDNSGCPTFPYKAFNSCGTGANGEMFTNYMDYTNGGCLNMFTAGQVTRMTAALNSSVSGRSNLWSNANLISTGVSDPYVYPPTCCAKPEILPFAPVIACVGDSIKFTDYSYGGISTSRTWNFNGGSPSSTTDSIVKAVYYAPGVYNVSLTKNYLSSTNSQTFTNHVYILNNTANTLYDFPFTEGFENTTNFNNSWTIVNRDNLTAWNLTNSTNYNGSNCAVLKVHNQSAPAIDELISPSIDMSAANSVTLSFKLHYAVTSFTPNTDKLSFQVSTDCGKSWFQLYNKSGNSLKTVTNNISPSYTPTSGSSEWRTETIVIDDSYLSNNWYFKFVLTNNGGGNNIFIDDINLNGVSTIGVNEKSINTNFVNLLPNPANNNVLIQFKNSGTKTIEIHNQLGQLLNTITTFDKEVNVNTENLKDGIYLFSIKDLNKNIIYKKVVIHH
ncbi:MAG: T9SS type A sorting domain-containing protein [Bacteroidetes bacterium]|mgnify:CR=1 FL=1|nr:T9SS type A sorting domain-containing protein [Bacteroidota bacterium]